MLFKPFQVERLVDEVRKAWSMRHSRPRKPLVSFLAPHPEPTNRA